MSFKNILNRTNLDYYNGADIVRFKRWEWQILEKRVKSILDQLISEVEDINYYDNIWYYTQDNINLKTYNQNFISLSIGRRFIGVGKEIAVLDTPEDIERGKKKSHFIVESGGQLVISQGPNGDGAIIVIPSKSEVLKPLESLIVYKLFSNPVNIYEEDIKWAVKFFLRYSFSTSYAGNPNILDKIWIAYIKIKSNFRLSSLIKALLPSAVKAITSPSPQETNDTNEE